MATLVNFFTISSNADPGVVLPTTAIPAAPATPGFVDLPKGAFKIAAMSSGLLWKLGSASVTVATGSYLAAGDQEVIIVTDAAGARLWFGLPTLETTDGEINIVPVQVFQIPGRDFRKYLP